MPPEGSGGEKKSVVVGVSWFAPFIESEQLRSRVTASRSRCRNHFSPLQRKDYHTFGQEPFCRMWVIIHFRLPQHQMVPRARVAARARQPELSVVL